MTVPWRRVPIIIALAVAAGLAAASATAAVRWVRLGERVVNDRLDHDTIAVTAAAGELTAVKLAVRRRPVHLVRLEVHFGNGESQAVPLKVVLPAGGETRAVDLAGGRRVVRSVELWYEAETVGRSRRAKVVLLGRR